mmetsp:Transcript_18890/g.38129  ORF Transcript_18890/g.38129 Transcript_18890/m.38129 type:complete len:141 (-) Transcript_18890:18-440(-)|eukprot:CAMPEP_0170407946 /NCGR_PEP_ID=MMETSP0117_2-20130122/28525_1 /TAXON_ID=400756 /ORGANISM="Durinskia baltica, Strain CSIRO CS-38" /LENGTH=140 /DNA_ID=CAMNT_0010665241 /DNA_START=50 /DNA_END=472 /DNA_ORIENTATION=-
MALEDNQKIGIGLICLGLIFVVIGIILFLDAKLIAIGNALFLVGLCFAIGIQRTVNLFTRRDRIRGTICFFAGIALVLMRWGVVGMCVEIFGFLNLFGNFLPTVLAVGRQIPILSTILDFPIVAQAADYIAGKTRPKYSV